MRERWRPVKGFPDYEISDRGRVRSYKNPRGFGDRSRLKKPHLMVVQTHRLGYKYVGLRRGGRQCKGYIHHLMADAFIPNPDNLPEVNHINGCKDDNRLENLEWCDRVGNLRHARETGLWDPKKAGDMLKEMCKRPVYCYETNMLFDTCADAADYFGVSRSSITLACQRDSHYVVGYHVCYEEDIDYLKRNIEKMQGLEKNYRPIKAINIHTGEERTYPSRREAANDLGMHNSGISNVLAGRICSVKGWTFRDIPIIFEERCGHE